MAEVLSAALIFTVVPLKLKFLVQALHRWGVWFILV